MTPRRWSLLATLAIVLVVSTYKLTESPPIWLDEGILIQVARNLAERSIHGLQVAPGAFVSGAFITTGYPVTLPVAAAFVVVGAGLLPARLVMVAYMLAVVLAAYALLHRGPAPRRTWLAMLLLATFAPFYGNGKNVLGEVPGLFFLLVVLVLLDRMVSRGGRPLASVGAGLALGFAVATKPLFILLVPVAALAVVRRAPPRHAALAAAAAVGPVLLWIWLQFGGSGPPDVLGRYANPYGLALGPTILGNARRFLTEAQPLYCAAVVAIWYASLARRWRAGRPILASEWVAAGFALLVLGAYLRTAGYYRYFFPAQVLALLYLPGALDALLGHRSSRRVATVALALLVGVQAYQLGFRSWVASYYGSRRGQELATALGSLPRGPLFVYQAPEAVLFLDTSEYWQYIEITAAEDVGSSTLGRLREGAPRFVVSTAEMVAASPDLFRLYRLRERVNRYAILERA